MKRVMGLLALTLALAAAAPGFSQELTAEEIAARLLAQKEGVLTRGLIIAPTGDVPADAVTPGVDVAAANYIVVPESEQVNIRISFNFDSAALNESEKPKILTMCEVVKTVDVNTFRIVGHTDASGTAEYNESLSKLRAEEVKRFMVEDCGIDGARLEAVGVGEQFPAVADDPRNDQNRRVEFQALS